ncbi:MAG: TonB-dependent receptor, partial [Colwellia sp.]|nr:TonB-dependent receptor [Colwellia sp.]
MKTDKLSLSKISRLSLSTTAIAIITALSSVPTYAEELQEVERIAITGSAIKRTDVENVLPVMVFDADSIAAQGINTTGELISKIPAMQGYTAVGAAMNNTSGQETASLRGLGASYTLVLLNGKRMASHSSSNTVDISSIPIAAIERVEVLTDGASAIYGADAITGVVNFILKTNFEGTKVEAKISQPQQDGGESNHFAITHGINGDNYNFVLSYSHDSQAQLKSTQRDYGKTGIVGFDYGGEKLVFTRLSSNAAPANFDLRFDGDLPEWRMNGYRADPLQGNGECAEYNIPQDSATSSRIQERCLYDFTEAVDIFPEKSVDTFLVNGAYTISDNMELYTSLLLSKTKSISRAAANFVSGMALDMDSAIVSELLLNDTPGAEVLTAEQRDNLNRARLRWRIAPGGPRTREFTVDAFNFTLGTNGDFNAVGTDWYYDTSVTYSDSSRSQNRLSGYIEAEGLGELLNSPTLIINPFLPVGQQSSAAVAAIDAINLNSQDYVTTDTDSLAIQGQLSGAIAELPAGEMYVATGFDYREVSYVTGANQDNLEEVMQGQSASTLYDLSRETYGMFVETVIPVIDGLEITAAYRYDNIGAITSSYTEPPENNGSGWVYNEREAYSEINDDVSETTYKLSIAYRPTDELL